MEEWKSLVTGQISVEQAAPLLARVSVELEALLKNRPQAEQQISDILSRQLGGRINTETWSVVASSLTNYLGSLDLVYLIGWLIETDQKDRLQVIEKHTSPHAMAFLRTIVGLYGPDLESALNSSDELPAEWSMFYRDVYYDQVNERHYLKMRIEKYNKEEVTIEGRADSILAFGVHLVRTLRMVGTAAAFSEKGIDEFLDEADQLRKLLRPEEEVSAETQTSSVTSLPPQTPQ